jgi:plastocyanin
MPTRTTYAILLAILCLLVAACGDDDDDGGGGGSSDDGGGSVYGGGGGGGADQEDASAATELKLTAARDGSPKFDKSSLSAKPGKVTVVLANPSRAPHAIEVEGNGVEAVGETVTDGGVSKVTVDLKAGEYEYYCPVGNHADAGMEGTLAVR